MSVCSNASGISVSVFGQDDVELEEALDSVFKQIQTFVNDTQCAIRCLAAVPEQCGEFMRALEIYTEIENNIDGLAVLFKEAKSVAKQVLGPVPASLKAEVKTYKENIKIKRQITKDAERNKKAEESKQDA